MPFAPAFDDVYDAVKRAIDDAVQVPGSCSRLDEIRPAGRITERLIQAMHSATFCIADITEERPNVMWELGYAMALQKPTIVITQGQSTLPFDIADVQTIRYDRNHLRGSLTEPLKRTVIDTLTSMRTSPSQVTDFGTPSDDELASVRSELADVKSMIYELVRATRPLVAAPKSDSFELERLTGSWVNIETGSHAYASLINNELIVPYSFGSDDDLTGVYFGWRRIGDYWFARYQWVDSDIAGFSFLKQDAVDLLRGAWWSSSGGETPAAPPSQKGVTATWRRVDAAAPEWAKRFFALVEGKGIDTVLASSTLPGKVMRREELKQVTAE